ncbi:MAG TPA: hypothetical protein VH253_01880, partial [Phycisphaerae bacterium]|nr:hypothetical protein [Phycisphaerae bacterium]
MERFPESLGNVQNFLAGGGGGELWFGALGILRENAMRMSVMVVGLLLAWGAAAARAEGYAQR